jgi:glutathione S-transferase
MKVYTGPVSLFSAKVRVALDEKGLPYEHVSVGWSLERRYEPHHPDVVALNPKAQVPVLVDGDLVVYDSTQILEYLEDRYPEPPLYPRDVPGRARCRRLEAFADEILFPPLWELIDGGFYPRAAGADGARLGAARARLAELHRALDRELDGREFLCGAFGVADVGCAVMTATAAALGAPPDPRLASLGGWLARATARPSLQRELGGMRAYAAGLRPAAARGARELVA